MYFVLIYHRVNSKTGLFSSHSRSHVIRILYVPVRYLFRSASVPPPFRLRFESVPVPLMNKE